MIQKIFIAIAFLFISQLAFTQTPVIKELPAARTVETIKIDGFLNEEAWKTAPVAKDFIEMRPVFGNPENENSKTEVYILYDNISRSFQFF